MHVESEYHDEISLSELFHLVRRGIVPALAVALVAAILAFFVARSMDPTFRAQATLAIAHANTSDMNRFGVSLASAPTMSPDVYRAATLSTPLLSAALESVGGLASTRGDIERLRSSTSVSVQSSNSSSLLSVSVEHESPDLAARLANGVSERLILWDEARATSHLQEIAAMLENQVEAIEAEIEMLRSEPGVEETEIAGRVALRAEQRQQLYYAQALQHSVVGMLNFVNPAEPPLAPVSPRPGLSAVLAFVLAFGAVFVLFFVREALDTRLRDSDDLSSRVGLPILAEFPKMPAMQRRLPAEAVRYLRTNVLFALANTHPMTILVASANPGEGKSSVAMSLAESFVRNHHRTLLVDADLRKPVIAGEYGVGRNVAELADYLRDPSLPLRTARVPMEGEEVLEVVPTFGASKEPTELLANGFRQWIATVQSEYDVIVIDAAPLLPVADSLTIAPHVSTSLLVARVGETHHADVTSAKQLLDRLGVRVAGAIATGVPLAARGSRSANGYYGYGYGYGHDRADGLPHGPPSASGTAPSAPALTRVGDR